jgi:TRAP-type C4-dicarboxylate transport system permease small subunit
VKDDHARTDQVDPVTADAESRWGRTPPHQIEGPVLRGIALVENIGILLLMSATVLTILAQVLFRRFLDQPLSWSTEVATTLLVYVAFIGFAIGARDNVHVAMRLFEDKFAPPLQRASRLVELVVMGAVVAAIGIGGGIYAYEQRDVVTPAGLPLWASFVALPIGCALGFGHILVEFAAVLRGVAETEPPREGAGISAAPERIEGA